ncbi:lipocalin-1-like [Saccopteryx leptura]|uniref:lipocalin-1-like n=1 Tax=Saccopteryx leptura TaxID=249018 RepID=UPI00339CAB20
MRALFLMVSLVAALQAHDPSVSGEETLDVSGKWYLKAMTSDQEVSRKELEVAHAIALKVLEGGDLEAKTTVVVNGQCREMTLVLQKTKEPGKYVSSGLKDAIHFTQSRVQDHYVLDCEGEIHGEKIRMMKLMGRDPEENREALEDFKNAVEARGFDPEKIVIPTQTEACSLDTA